MSTQRWKLDDDESIDDIGSSVGLGSMFARAIQEDKLLPKRREAQAQYGSHRKLFFEDPLYNPGWANTHISHEYEAHEKEQIKSWQKNGYQWSNSNDVRFRPVVYHSPGPLKPATIPNVFEKPDKYWGRERIINPFSRAKIYTRPNNRCKPFVKLSYLEESANLGPGRYDIPDPWKEGFKPVAGKIR